MSEQTTRRSVLQTAGAFAISSQAHRILGANDRVNLAIIGIGGRGTAHLRSYLALPESNVMALCDVNQEAQERAQATVKRTKGNDAKIYTDMRKLFDDKEVDAVSVATPNHWHALTTIWACQAGKDVYVEKPVSHNVFEGRQMTAAARKYKRIVQAGTQSRSTAHKMEAMKLIAGGEIGKVYMAKALCYKRRKTIGKAPLLDTPPPGVDWDLFLGPAPMKKFSTNRFKYNWHWFWDTGNGDIGNQGVHSGGKFVYDDDQETPNMQLATFDFGDSQLIFEVRGLPTHEDAPLKARGANTVGNIFWGSEGVLAVDGGGYWIYKGEERQMVKEGKAQRGDDAPHMGNFLKAVKSRNPAGLNAEVAVNALASNYCHLANIAYRTGRKLTWNAKTEKFHDAEADAMLTRKYRAPYIVPERV
jgi:predicted dehydrogenase